MEVRGYRGVDPWLPHMLGHEASGRVLEIGEGVRKVRRGDNVVLTWIRSTGLDGGGAQWTSASGQVNAGPVTTFATHTIVSENRLVPLPANVPLDVAVLFGCALPTGAGMVLNQIRPEAGSSIAIIGLGGVGLSALIAAQLFECRIVIAVDNAPGKLDEARRFGATHTIDASCEDPVEAIRALTNGRGVDYSVEAAGNASTIEIAFSSVRTHGGRCVFASHPPSGTKICLDPHDLISGRTLEGSWGGATEPDRDVPLLARLFQDRRLPLERLLTKRYALEEVNDALDDMEQQHVTRPLVVMA